MNDALLSVRNLCIQYSATVHSTVRAVNGINLDIFPGEIIGIVGESGSGKSTLALSLLGLLDNSGHIVQGEMRFRGVDLRGLDESGWQKIRGRQIGMIFQSPEASFNPVSTIGQQIQETLLQTYRNMRKDEARIAAKAVLTTAGMPRAAEVLECYPFELSGGMCQRAALAMAVSLQPALLLADEPTAALDLLAQLEITHLLVEMNRLKGLSMMVISHDLGLIARIASRVMIMYAGRIVESGPVAQILQTPRHPYTQGLLASMPQLEEHPPPFLAMLPGQAPDMMYPVAGCTFLPRCERAGERCREEQPVMVSLQTGRYVECWYPDAPLSKQIQQIEE